LARPSGLDAWDHQIRTFAKCFLDNARLPRGPFTLLDVGCGTGSALREISSRYPEALLFGCDVEQEHVDIAARMNGNVATFFKAELREIQDYYDVIYVSNVFEHLPGWKEAVLYLTGHARRAYVLVPFKEILREPDKELPPGVAHVVRFEKEAFDFLKDLGFVVTTRKVRTPSAWGDGWPREIRQRLVAFLGARPPYEARRQLLASISGPATVGVLRASPFCSRMSSQAARWRRIVSGRVRGRRGVKACTGAGSTA
jgi:SAM-dependent methyltransferase